MGPIQYQVYHYPVLFIIVYLMSRVVLANYTYRVKIQEFNNFYGLAISDLWNLCHDFKTHLWRVPGRIEPSDQKKSCSKGSRTAESARKGRDLDQCPLLRSLLLVFRLFLEHSEFTVTRVQSQSWQIMIGCMEPTEFLGMRKKWGSKNTDADSYDGFSS